MLMNSAAMPLLYNLVHILTSSALAPNPHRPDMASSSSTQRPIVFMDIQIGETPAGRIKFELFSDIVPKYATRSNGLERELLLIMNNLELPKTSGSYALESTGILAEVVSIRSVY